jgi:hypothetical protein
MTSLTSPKAKLRRDKLSKADFEIDKTIICTLMRTGDGRRHIYRRLFFSGIWHEDGNLDPQRMAWKAGLRNEGLRLLALIHEHCPEEYAKMWHESNRLKADEAAADKAEQEETAEAVTEDGK